MATLRDSERLGAHDEIRGLCRLVQAGFAILYPDGTKFVVMGVTRAERGQILHQHLEDQSALDCGRKHALDVFHHEGGRAKLVEDPDVIAKEVVPRILLRDIADLASRADAPHQGIGLTRRAADQDRVGVLLFQRRDGAINGGCRSLGAELKCAGFVDGMLPRFGIDG